ncbi:hypothetical protein RO3G_05746 [Lichtheimia corymbifera JMRC:FSU:9682]|uniref:BZIP domain-containing protein n=1 Tax=Lichtheimia corymbifera JMRC:FSU:9682 TaxID=1263082 RepID=A0A068S0S1_9FUNG|nr:hypothetical protein RO3G_05746 [Lichtheimia corymbifera JMRC:FSU:9682]
MLVASSTNNNTDSTAMTSTLLPTSTSHSKYTPTHDFQSMLTTPVTTQSTHSTASECPPPLDPSRNHDPSTSAVGTADSLPPTYASLPQTTKLEEEPNPFEQSFSSSRVTSKDTLRPVLPPLASIDSPTRGLSFRKDELIWDSLRTGPLSPSMLTGPADDKRPPPTPIKGTTSGSSFLSSSSSSSSSSTISSSSSPLSQHSATPQKSSSLTKSDPSVNRAHDSSPTTTSGGLGNIVSYPTEDTTSSPPPSSPSNAPTWSFVKRADSAPEAGFIQQQRPTFKRRAQSTNTDHEDEKRKNFLERNRLAAYKCRQRKKQWMQDLQARVEFLTTDNEQLQMQTTALREQLIDLKTMLLEHKSCPVNTQAVIEAVNRPIPGMIPRSQYRASITPSNSRYSPYPSRSPTTAAGGAITGSNHRPYHPHTHSL